MKKTTSKEILLALLVIGLGVVGYIQYSKWADKHKNSSEAIRASVLQVNPTTLPAVLDVSLGRGPSVKIRDKSRNLFNYSKSPDEVADEIHQQREAERLARQAEERRQQQQQAEVELARQRAINEANGPPKIPDPPPITFRFIGKMGAPRSPIAVLADSSDIYTVREGEVIGGKFKVKKIDYDAVTIGYADPLVTQYPDWAQRDKIVKMGG